MIAESGTRWEGNSAERYEAARHGPDGEIFLDPYLYTFLSPHTVKDATAIDIGAGTGPWTNYLSRAGASLVVSLDLNSAMLQKAQAERFWRGNGLLHHPQGHTGDILLVQGSASALPHPDNLFDVATSINVGCNLPSVGKNKDGGTIHPFQMHFAEAYRVTKPGGVFLVTAPDSLTTVFTDGVETESVQSTIDKKWEEVKGLENADTIAEAKKVLSSLVHVLRGTFVLDESGKPILITEQNRHLVNSGNLILRKIPGLVVNNIYHSADEYREAARSAGWNIEEDVTASFKNEDARNAYNRHQAPGKQLGQAYVGNPPFLVLKLTKPISDILPASTTPSSAATFPSQR